MHRGSEFSLAILRWTGRTSATRPIFGSGLYSAIAIRPTLSGARSARTATGISPSLCADPGYVKMRLARILLIDLPPGEADKVKRECQGRQ